MDQLINEHAPATRELDAWGLALTTHSTAAARAYDSALLGMLAHRADTPQRLEAALAHDPKLALAHLMRGFALRLLARSDALEEAKHALRAAERSLQERPGTWRERTLCAGLRAFCAHDQERAIALLAAIVEAEPQCLLSMKLHHALCFMNGRVADMARTAGRSLARVTRELPGYTFLVGCYAFALEECGQYADAERLARGALSSGPEDPWTYHALLHVFTMRDRGQQALDSLRAQGQRFSATNNFAAHLSWHHALFALASDQLDEALALYDQQVVHALARDYRDLANCASLLFRLERAGVDVGTRWQPLADWAAAREGDHLLAFADLHQLLALLGAGRTTSARAYVRSMRTSAMQRMDSAALLTRKVGLPMADGLVALYTGDAQHAIRRLWPLACPSAKLGGSNAQRELFEMFAVEAAFESGDDRLARELLARQLERRPDCRWALRYGARPLEDRRAR